MIVTFYFFTATVDIWKQKDQPTCRQKVIASSQQIHVIKKFAIKTLDPGSGTLSLFIYCWFKSNIYLVSCY